MAGTLFSSGERLTPDLLRLVCRKLENSHGYATLMSVLHSEYSSFQNILELYRFRNVSRETRGLVSERLRHIGGTLQLGNFSEQVHFHILRVCSRLLCPEPVHQPVSQSSTSQQEASSDREFFFEFLKRTRSIGIDSTALRTFSYVNPEGKDSPLVPGRPHTQSCLLPHPRSPASGSFGLRADRRWL